MFIFHTEICSPNTLVCRAKHMKYPTNIPIEFFPVKTIWCKTKEQKNNLVQNQGIEIRAPHHLISPSELHYSIAGAAQLERIPFP